MLCLWLWPRTCPRHNRLKSFLWKLFLSLRLFDLSSATKPDPFFWVEPNFGPKIRVELGRVGPQEQKTGPMGSGWPQIVFKFGFNPIMYLINPNEPDLNLISGQVGTPGSKFGLSRVGLGPQGPNLGWVGSGWSGSFGRTKLQTSHVRYFSLNLKFW